VSGTSPGTGVVTAVVVDDTPDIRMLTRLALELDGGIRVVAEAQNGREGIDVVEHHQPDVVVLDMAMPVMDGLEALPHMQRVSPGTRFLVVSGFDDATMAASVVEAGADGYLQKGAPPATLLERVREIATLPAGQTGRPDSV
jgi:DNA-binding NarL/FixJ family response regulator